MPRHLDCRYPGRSQRVVALAGGPFAVSCALSLVLRHIFTAPPADGGGGGGGDGAGADVPRAVIFAVPEAAAGRLIGRGGANVNALRARLPDGASFTVADAASCGVDYEARLSIGTRGVAARNN